MLITAADADWRKSVIYIYVYCRVGHLSHSSLKFVLSISADGLRIVLRILMAPCSILRLKDGWPFLLFLPSKWGSGYCSSSGFEPRWGQDSFSFLNPSGPTLVPTESPVQFVSRLFPGAKRPEPGVYQPTPPSAEGNNE